MAHFQLVPFDPSSAPALQIEAQINPHDDAIFISYKLTGDLSAIDLDSIPKHERALFLWKKTCFELFIKNQHDQYMEFNFSPVFEWNAFYFKQKGDELKEWEKIKQVKVDILHSLEVFHLIAEIKKADFPVDFFGQNQAGISSVIKDKAGNLTYWALTHADQRPNFHHFDSFKYKF